MALYLTLEYLKWHALYNYVHKYDYNYIIFYS